MKTKTYFRKYNSDFFKYWFVFSGADQKRILQCMVGFETLSNGCMKLLKLETYLKT